MEKIKQLLFILLGPVAFGLIEMSHPPNSMSIEALHVLASTVWIAIWWITEIIPIAVTSMLPILLFPLTGAMDLNTTTASYGDKYIFLYLGGFILAITIEKWGLHKRIALSIIRLIGVNITTIILGFMLATAFLSMWISNTATAVMMLPIGMAVVSQFKEHNHGLGLDAEHIGRAIMISIAYSASIGGFATLIGTPPNLVLAGILEETYGIKISFFQWLQFGLPLSLLTLLLCWVYLTKIANKFGQKEFPGGIEKIKSMLTQLGKVSYEERIVLVVFVTTALLWIFRALIQDIIPAFDDTIVGVMAGTCLFLIPAKEKGKRLITWSDCSKEVPWGILLLFGGGMALAKGFTVTGLAQWIATQITMLQGISLILLILILVAAINFLTEVTSNIATTAMILPVLAPMALAFNLHPLMIMVPVTISASCAFMLPVATPPNAVVFASGYLKISDMIKSGIWMNLTTIFLITLLTYFLLPIIWGINPNEFPIQLPQP